MPDSLLVWALTASVGALASVLWWLGRKSITKLDNVSDAVNQLRQSISDDIGLIRERLARIEGHIWPPR